MNYIFGANTPRVLNLISLSLSKPMKHIERPHTLIEEDQQSRRASPFARVDRMFEQMREKLSEPPKFILCVLPERKNSDIYGIFYPENQFYLSFLDIYGLIFY